MIPAWRFPFVRLGTVIFLVVLLAIVLLPGLRMGGFSPGNFLPHSTCYMQDARLIWLHAITDSLIALAYFAISGTLGVIVYRARRDIPFHWMFIAFGLFIVTCGFTHVMAVVNIWQPLYWLSGDAKVVTATASVATALALPLLVPRVFKLIHSAKLSEDRQRAIIAANAELKDLYEKVKEVDEVKSQFFANVSHELRTPLSLILGPVARLEETPLSSEQQQQVGTIRRNSQLLLKHVNDLLEASRLEAGREKMDYSRVDLAWLTRISCSYFVSMASDRRVQFQTESPETVMIEGDGEKLQRVLLNLLSNAFKFVPAEGSITCTLTADDRQAQLVVQDNGPGIPPKMREAVFERFRQVEGGDRRRFGGTGLGLSIARDFVELHGGTIQVTETPGGGATFTVTLPLHAPAGTEIRENSPGDISPPGNLSGVTADLARSPAPAPRESEEKLRADPTKAVVLVVEDDVELNQFISEVLARHYSVVSAHDGEEGLEKARRIEPEVILSDIMMPKMSGDQLVAAIRAEEKLAETPIILLSAKADQDMQLKLLRHGATDFIVKPFRLEELEARVANLVAMAQVRKLLERELKVGGRNLAELTGEILHKKQEAETALESKRKAEEALRRLNAELENRVEERTRDLRASNQEMESFTSTASHDLRAPLRAVQGLANVLLEDYASAMDERAQNYAHRIIAAAARMDALIKDLLEYSRLGRQEIELSPVRLDPLIQEVRASLDGELTKTHASIIVEDVEGQVIAQETLLKQVLSNLLENALKYVAPGVTPEVRIRAKTKGDRIRLEVHDNGIGIPAEFRQKIFEIFHRLDSAANYPGTGLGLAILAKAMGRMHGEFGVESAPGEGSSFWVDLRRAPDEAK